MPGAPLPTSSTKLLRWNTGCVSNIGGAPNHGGNGTRSCDTQVLKDLKGSSDENLTTGK